MIFSDAISLPDFGLKWLADIWEESTKPTQVPNTIPSFEEYALAIVHTVQQITLDPAAIIIFLLATTALILIYIFLFSAPIRFRHHYSPINIECLHPNGNEKIKIGLMELIQKDCPALFKGVFYPTPWLLSGHLQTIYAALMGSWFKANRVPFVRVTLPTQDGGVISVDWQQSVPEKGSSTPILILLHGLTGGSHESYIQDVIEGVSSFGFKSLVFNFRGCSDSQITTPQLYSASYTKDLNIVVQYVHDIMGKDIVLYGCGFSMGANILLKYSGEMGDDCPFSGLVSIANPFDLTSTNFEVHNSLIKRNIYSQRLATNLIRVLKRHMHVFEGNDMYDLPKIINSRSIMEFDEHFTRKTFNFDSVQDYYHKGSCFHFLPNIKRPTLCLNALDDPIVPGKIIPYSQIISNPYIIIGTTCYGGHLGWYSNWICPKRWFSTPVSEFLIALYSALSSLPRHDDIKLPKDTALVKNASIQTQSSLEVKASDKSTDTRDKLQPIVFFKSSNQSQSQQLIRSHFFKPWKMASLIAILSFLIRSSLRRPSAIRALQKYLSLPGMISFGGGNPNPETFPFESFSIQLKSGQTLDVSPSDMQKALQYSPTAGLPDLVDWLKQLQVQMHRKDKNSFDICIGNGSQDVLTKAFEMLIDPGDVILIEAPAYSGTLSFLKPLGCNFAEVECDQDGLNPLHLERVLSEFDNESRPKVLYSVPVGGNPSGASTTVERKRKIYQIAQKYDLLILEDDPYWYLQFEGKDDSYFSMDHDGRVLRFDSFSKILSAGARIGWVSGPKELVDKIVLHGMASNLHPSGISQIFLYSLLKEWQLEGFLKHTEKVCRFYKERRDLFLDCANKHLNGLAVWTVPKAGMFLWINILGVDDSADLIYSKAVKEKVILVPGFEFYPNSRISNHVRAAYSMATLEEMDAGLKRLGELIRSIKKE